MIISASRRTDIPCYHGDYFMECLKNGKILVNTKYINLKKADFFIFWTKNVDPFLKHIKHLPENKYYFQYTLNNYSDLIEKKIPSYMHRLNSFKNLSNLIGPDKVIWRYDPILLSDVYTIDWHLENFNKMCKDLKSYTNSVKISFIDIYTKIELLMHNMHIRELKDYEQLAILEAFNYIANTHNMKLTTCGESHTKYTGKCVDDVLINQITDSNIVYKKDSSQRPLCACHTSIDIGEYKTCKNGCIYCYAN